jgi:hypothetical protein
MVLLTGSVSWIEGFIVFLDDYHRDLTKAKFNQESMERHHTIGQAHPGGSYKPLQWHVQFV